MTDNLLVSAKRISVIFLSSVIIFAYSFPVVATDTTSTSVTVGPQGEIGPTGPLGPQGTIGPQDSPTPAPVINSVSVDSSPSPLPTASPTPVVGPTGPVGPQGTVGPAGPTGPQPLANDSNTNQLSNSNTGPNSLNQNSGSTTSTTTATLTNSSTTNNIANVSANTGYNSLANNTSVGNVTTGSINGTVNLVNISNALLGQGSSIGGQTLSGGTTNQLILNPIDNRIDLANSTTGPNSINLNNLSSNNIIRIFNTNEATTNNTIGIIANTGNNNASNNTQLGDYATGNINLGINLINLANLLLPNTTLTINSWSILDGLNGTLVLSDLANSNTGPNSANSNTISSTNNTNLSMTNNATTTNALGVNVSSGGNTIANNSTTGSVSTGPVAIEQAATTLANLAQPIVYIVNVFGHWVGSLLGLNPDNVIVNEINDQTGPNSSNQNQVTANQTTDITVNNTATTTNNVSISANTGGNTIANNTKVGSIKTGSITVGTNVINILNSFASQFGQLRLGIINIFGNWNGNASDHPEVAASPVPASSTNQSATSVTQSTSIPSPIKVTTLVDIIPTLTSATQSHNATSQTTTHQTVQQTHKRKIASAGVGGTTTPPQNESPLSQQNPSLVHGVAFGPVLVKDYASSLNSSPPNQSPLAGSMPARTLTLLLGLAFILLWGMIEALSYRQRKLAHI